MRLWKSVNENEVERDSNMLKKKMMIKIEGKNNIWEEIGSKMMWYNSSIKINELE
jgi:hypothetical protein